MSFFTFHAQQRAKERYGLRLSAKDIEAIGEACVKLPTLRELKTRCTIHVYRHGDVALVVMLNPEKTRVMSFLPADYFGRTTRLARRRDIYGAKQPRAKQAAPNARRKTKASVIAASREGDE